MRLELAAHGIVVDIIEDADGPTGSGSIESSLTDDLTDRAQHYAFEGMLSLILAHGCAGVDILSPEYAEGIDTTVDAIWNI
jgi:hypothetical protein